MRELILDLNRQHGITVLISSHILDELSRLATHYGFIDGGHMLRELSAAELESRCRKCQRIETDNVRALVRALDRLGAEYAVADETHADVFTPFSVTRLALFADAEGCEIRSIRERDESLESQDGTLRNKLIAGHARGRVYAAYLVAAVAGCFAITLAWLLSAAVGVAKLGWFTAPAGTLGLAAALILLLTATSRSRSCRTAASALKMVPRSSEKCRLSAFSIASSRSRAQAAPPVSVSPSPASSQSA